MVPRAHLSQNPNGISIGSAVFVQITAEHPYSLQWATLYPLKITPYYGRIWTPSNTWFLTLTQAHNPNGISIVSDVFANNADYFTMGRPFPPQNCPFQWRESGPHLIHGSLSPPEPTTQKASRLVQPFLQGSVVTDRQTVRPTTDQTTRSVTIGRIYTCDTAMQPKKQNFYF